jgi:hypothetical protein
MSSANVSVPVIGPVKKNHMWIVLAIAAIAAGYWYYKKRQSAKSADDSVINAGQMNISKAKASEIVLPFKAVGMNNASDPFVTLEIQTNAAKAALAQIGNNFKVNRAILAQIDRNNRLSAKGDLPLDAVTTDPSGPVVKLALRRSAINNLFPERVPDPVDPDKKIVNPNDKYLSQAQMLNTFLVVYLVVEPFAPSAYAQ